MSEADLLPREAPTERSVELNLQAFGVPYTLRLFDQNLVAEVTSLLPQPSGPGVAPSAADSDAFFELTSERDGTVRVLQGPRQLLASRDLELSLWVLSDLVHEYVCYSATTGIFIRGAAVVHEGRAIVILGEPLSGRSTLAGELVRHGARPWADSYVLLDEEGRLLPFEGPHVRESHADVSQHELSALPAASIGLVVKTTYRPGTTWEPARQSTGEAMLALLAEAVAVHGRGPETMKALRNAVCDAALLNGDRGEASEAAEVIIGALTGGAAT